MANTIVQIDVPESLLPVMAYMTSTIPGLVAADIAGYIVNAGDSESKFYIIVPEACIGIYRITLHDADGICIAIGYVYIAADDTNTYIATAEHNSAITFQLMSSDQIMQPDGSGYKLRNYSRGTTTDVIPSKAAKKIDGSNLSDPFNEMWAGYQQ